MMARQFRDLYLNADWQERATFLRERFLEHWTLQDACYTSKPEYFRRFSAG